MALHTAFTELFSVRRPIALAPMGGTAGGALAAAVSNGGGLGLPGHGRTLGHPYLDGWRDRENELAADAHALQAYRDGVASGELPEEPVWAGEAGDLITDLPPAADLVETLAGEAEHALARALS